MRVGEGTVGAKEKKDLRDTLAHEFMHVLQDSLDVSCPGTYWWREATANWAMDEAYPGDNHEHDYAPAYLKDMDNPLPTDCDSCLREYGSYVFPFWIARSLRPGRSGDPGTGCRRSRRSTRSTTSCPVGSRSNGRGSRSTVGTRTPSTTTRAGTGWTKGASTYTKEQELSPGSDVALNGVQKLQYLSAKYFTFKVGGGVRTLGSPDPLPRTTAGIGR